MHTGLSCNSTISNIQFEKITLIIIPAPTANIEKFQLSLAYFNWQNICLGTQACIKKKTDLISDNKHLSQPWILPSLS